MTTFTKDLKADCNFSDYGGSNMPENRLPDYVNPLRRGYRSYMDSLRQFNESFQREIREVITDKLGELSSNDFSIFTTGSDGRLEKGPQSKFEIVVSGRGDYRAESEDVVTEIRSQLGDILDPDIEHKTLDQLHISGYNGSLDKIFPTRVLDMRLLYGSPAVLEDAHA